MRALILSDIHANLEALQAVLEVAHATESGRFDTLWNLGDSVGYGGSPNQVVECIRPLAALTVRGNHDRVCCGLSSATNFNPVARAAVEWTKKELTAENVTWLRELPQGPLHPHAARRATASVPAEVLIAAGSIADPELESPLSTEPDLDPTTLFTAVALAHGSPLHEDHYILNMRDAWAPLQQMPSPVTFIGHTHVQGGFAQHGSQWNELRPRFFSRSHAETWTLRLDPENRHLINPGSVGQPRDADWRAAFAVYDTDAAEITFHRVPYDVTAAQGHILMAGLPERLAARLREGR